MAEKIRAFFRERMLPSASPSADGDGPELRVAAAALLLELAHADDAFTPDERAHLQATVRRHFGLSRDAGQRLLALADWRRRVHHDEVGHFGRLINEHYSPTQKRVLVEVMWGLVNSDGTLAPKEEELMKRITAVLDVDEDHRKEGEDEAAPDHEGDHGG
jgi:uncharacterized tellurite resistance protein B-like protein